jgi:hypothetical protein
MIYIFLLIKFKNHAIYFKLIPLEYISEKLIPLEYISEKLIPSSFSK